jgi:hypothetical protein
VAVLLKGRKMFLKGVGVAVKEDVRGGCQAVWVREWEDVMGMAV